MIRSKAVCAAALCAAALTVAGCSNKAQQAYNDAPRTATQNDGPAQVVTMPDGFSNVASKCDGPNRVYVLFHSDGSYGSVSVVANDPRCMAAAK
jgi:PBP1b-binding outer membrane lipoprotein LpoB